MITKILVAALIVGIGVVSYVYGRDVTFKEQWLIYESLRNTAAIIFGVMGAWLALIYPGAVTNVLQGKSDSAGTRRSGPIRKLLAPIIVSTIIVTAVLLIGLLAPITRHISLSGNTVEALRGASYALLSLLTILQIWALALALLPADLLKRNIERQDKASARRSRALSSTQQFSGNDRK